MEGDDHRGDDHVARDREDEASAAGPYAADDARLLFEVGLKVANGEDYPKWKAGSEFKARREEMLKQAGVK